MYIIEFIYIFNCRYALYHVDNHVDPRSILGLVGAGASVVNKPQKQLPRFCSPLLPRLGLAARPKVFLKVVSGASFGGRRLPAFNKWRAGKDFSKDAAVSAKHLRHSAPVKCLTSKTCSTRPFPPVDYPPVPPTPLAARASAAAIVACLVAVFDKFSLSAFWT